MSSLFVSLITVIYNLISMSINCTKHEIKLVNILKHFDFLANSNLPATGRQGTGLMDTGDLIITGVQI